MHHTNWLTFLVVSGTSLVTFVRPCLSQVVPVIELSAAEAAQAKGLSQKLEHDRKRALDANAAWQSFTQSFQAAHPELTDPKFTSDYRLAFSYRPGQEPYLIFSVKLSADEQQKASSLYREKVESQEALRTAEREWRDFQYELVDKHVPNPSGGGAVVVLPGGKRTVIAEPWSRGVAFTSDFGLAVPRH